MQQETYNLFHCEDQNSQNHKKKFQNRMMCNNCDKGGSKLPIQKLFDVEHCSNASSNLSDYTKERFFLQA
jgi:hypothetical protein